jgi:Mn2+/Fe2+ NRAMP family transporter
MNARRGLPAESPNTFRPFDLLLLGAVIVIATGIALGSRRLQTAAGAARRAMERETVAAVTLGLVGATLLVLAVVVVVGAGVARRRANARAAEARALPPT